MNSKKNNGSVLLIAVVFVLLTFLGVIFYKKFSDKKHINNTVTISDEIASPSATVSPSNDLNVIDKELDETNVTSVDLEFKEMNSSASSL